MSLLLYFLLVQVTLLIPGYVFIRKLKIFNRSPGVEICLGYSASLVFFALLATLSYVFKINPDVPRVLIWLAFFLSLWFFIRDKIYNDLYTFRFPIACLLAMSLFSLAFIGLNFSSLRIYIPDPAPIAGQRYDAFNVKVLNVAQTQANDNYIPYRQAQFYTNRSDPAKDSFISEWGVNFFVRTPLMGAVTASYFNLLGDRPPIGYVWNQDSTDKDQTYIKFQIIAHILNSLLIIPAYFLLSALFNRRVAAMALLFIITSQFFLYNSFFSWPKSLVAFFILSSWLLLRERKITYTAAAGLVSGFAYLTHDLAVLYIGASLVFLLFSRRLREIIFFSIPAIILALPWLIASSLVYKKPSSFIYYPISTLDIPRLEYKQQIIQQFFDTSPFKLLYIRLENIFYLLSPYQLFSSEGGQDLLRRLWALGLYSIPGSVGIGLIIPTYLALVKKIKTLTIWAFIFTPVILCVLVIGWPKGLGSLHFAGSIVVLLTGYAVSLLAQLKNSLLLSVAYIANGLQLAFFIAYSYKFAVGGWFLQGTDILRLGFMAIIVTASGWLVYKLVNNKRIPAILDPR